MNYKEFQEKLVKLEKKYNKNFKEIYHALNLLLEDKAAQEELKKQRSYRLQNKIFIMMFFRKYYYGDIPGENLGSGQANTKTEWPLWEVFIRSKQGLDHKHVGSLHAADAQMAVENARDVYTRRQEGVSIWVVESKCIHASNPDEADSFYEPAQDKVYRHPTFYDLPDEVKHM